MAHSKLSLLSAALVVVLGSYSATGIAAPQDAPYPNQAPTNAPTLARGGNVNYSIDYATPAPAPTPVATNQASPAVSPAPAATQVPAAPPAPATPATTTSVAPQAPAAPAYETSAPAYETSAPAQVYERPVPAHYYEQVLPNTNNTTNYTVSYGTTEPATPATPVQPAAQPAQVAPATSVATAAAAAPATTATYAPAAHQVSYSYETAPSAAAISSYNSATPATSTSTYSYSQPGDYSSQPVMEELGASPTSDANSFNIAQGSSTAASPGAAFNEQIQEVSVPLISTLDNALLDGFKSLASGLTMGMGVEVDTGSSSSFNYTLDDIAPALRGFNYEADGSVVMSFSVPMVENILKKQGDVAWSGLSNPVLVWMVNLDGTSMELTSGQELNSFDQALLSAAPEYKYRLMFPILDLEERSSISATTILDHQAEALAIATERYGSDYFMIATLSSVPGEEGVTLKWSLYDKAGGEIGSSSLSGIASEVAALSVGDIARTLMRYQATLTEQVTPSRLKGSNVDIDMLGPGEGFVRFKLTNVKSLQDLQAMRNAFVRYGFDGSINIIGYQEGAYVVEIVTNSNATNLEGTMRRAGDFVYLAPWTFSLSENVTYRPPLNNTVGPQNPDRPNSKLQAPGSHFFNQGSQPTAQPAVPTAQRAVPTVQPAVPVAAATPTAQPAVPVSAAVPTYQNRPAPQGAMSQVGPYQQNTPDLPF